LLSFYIKLLSTPPTVLNFSLFLLFCLNLSNLVNNSSFWILSFSSFNSSKSFWFFSPIFSFVHSLWSSSLNHPFSVLNCSNYRSFFCKFLHHFILFHLTFEIIYFCWSLKSKTSFSFPDFATSPFQKFVCLFKDFSKLLMLFCCSKIWSSFSSSVAHD
jgi:hypothetical protein